MGYLRVNDIPESERHLYSIPANADHVPDPQVAPWVVKAFDWYLSGVSLVKISERLNRAGVRSVRGTPLTYSSLRRCLDGGFHAGLIVDRRSGADVFVPGAHEAIVTREVFQAYKQKLRDTSRL